ncbi:hypothetical protein [Pseudoscardovia radai]|uniref:hypothetical protein n=1 Tax=Pseudoscardovia radai TaxID=987066 RepID=UPI001FED0976|nr:hypothetical protein [Pseudoscardovia radai]
MGTLFIGARFRSFAGDGVPVIGIGAGIASVFAPGTGAIRGVLRLREVHRLFGLRSVIAVRRNLRGRIFRSRAGLRGFCRSGFFSSGFINCGLIRSGFFDDGFFRRVFFDNGFIDSGFFHSGFFSNGCFSNGLVSRVFLHGGFLHSAFFSRLHLRLPCCGYLRALHGILCSIIRRDIFRGILHSIFRGILCSIFRGILHSGSGRLHQVITAFLASQAIAHAIGKSRIGERTIGRSFGEISHS